jgi:DNA-binding GntR family transcriptional regulator
MSTLKLSGRVIARSATAQAGDLIRAAIIDGSLVPGQRLREVDLARELGLSRTPVREALALLHADGLVELTANRGARVATYDRADLADCYGVRAVLEGYAAHQAATRATPEQVAALEHSCDRFDALRADGEDILPLVAENLRFHGIVHDASGSRRVPALVRGLIQLPLLYRAHAWYSPDRHVISEHHHRELAAAIGSHDAGRSERIMREHVLEAGVAALRAFDEVDAADHTARPAAH